MCSSRSSSSCWMRHGQHSSRGSDGNHLQHHHHLRDVRAVSLPFHHFHHLRCGGAVCTLRCSQAPLARLQAKLPWLSQGLFQFYSISCLMAKWSYAGPLPPLFELSDSQALASFTEYGGGGRRCVRIAKAMHNKEYMSTRHDSIHMHMIRFTHTNIHTCMHACMH